ncbi:MAG: tetratricopeptide repeat protein [Gemmatimonadaceae bacterium]
MSARRVARLTALAALAAIALGCATREDLRLLQTDLTVTRAQQARADSVVHGELGRLAATLAVVNDSMMTLGGRLTKLQGDIRGDLFAIGQQLIQIQELTGQSQARVQELRASLEQRSAERAMQPVSPAPPGGAAAPTATTTQAPSMLPGAPGPNTLFQLSLDQLRRGSAGAARSGFEELLRQYPAADVAPDAQFYIAEALSAERNQAAADSAYAAVVAKYPSSPRAPTALYKRAMSLEGAGRAAESRALLTQLVASYPRSDEASLARERLGTPK